LVVVVIDQRFSGSHEKCHHQENSFNNQQIEAYMEGNILTKSTGKIEDQKAKQNVFN
jgi:hypothetical protein